MSVASTPATGNNTASGSVTVTGGVTPPGNGADIEVGISTAPASPTIGNLVTYTLAVENLGPQTANGVTVTDNIGLDAPTLSNPTVTSGNAVISGGQLNGTFASIVSGGIDNVIFTATPTATGTVSDTATVTDNSINTDPNLANNTATNTITVGSVAPVTTSLSLSQAATSPVTQTTPTTAIAYTVILTNTGPSAATTVALTDTLPAGFTETGVTATTGTPTVSGSTVSLNLASLPFPGSDTVVISGTVAAPGAFSNVASVTAGNVSVASRRLDAGHHRQLRDDLAAGDLGHWFAQPRGGPEQRRDLHRHGEEHQCLGPDRHRGGRRAPQRLDVR